MKNIVLQKMAKLPNYLMMILSSVLGFMSVVLPAHMLKDQSYLQYNSPVFPFVRNAIENLEFIPTVLLLVLIGWIFGAANRELWWKLALSTMSLFPLMVLIEVVVDPKSHNIWPIEIIIYLLLTIPALIGAFIAKKMH